MIPNTEHPQEAVTYDAPCPACGVIVVWTATRTSFGTQHGDTHRVAIACPRCPE